MPVTLPITTLSAAAAGRMLAASSAASAAAPIVPRIIFAPSQSSATARKLVGCIRHRERPERFRRVFGIARIDELRRRQLVLDVAFLEIPVLHVQEARHVEAAVGIARLPRKFV